MLREALDTNGVIDALVDILVDRRDQLRIRLSLANQLRTLILQRVMGWIDLSGTDTLRRDSLWLLTCSNEPARPSAVFARPLTLVKKWRGLFPIVCYIVFHNRGVLHCISQWE